MKPFLPLTFLLVLLATAWYFDVDENWHEKNLGGLCIRHLKYDKCAHWIEQKEVP